MPDRDQKRDCAIYTRIGFTTYMIPPSYIYVIGSQKKNLYDGMDMSLKIAFGYSDDLSQDVTPENSVMIHQI